MDSGRKRLDPHWSHWISCTPVANAPDSISCSADTTIFVPANHYGVFKADSRGFVLLAIALAVALALRAWEAAESSLWLDELHTLSHARRVR